MKNIYLIGMPSSGKSTLGKQLASSLGYSFKDMDKLIETREQKTISEIFNTKGEEYFREIEKKVLNSFQKDEKMVIATGGGTPCFFDNMEFIKENGVSIFLNVDVEDIAKRIYKAKGNNRPLLDKNNSEEVIKNEIKNTYENRLSIYKKADLQVDGEINVSQLEWILDSYLVN